MQIDRNSSHDPKGSGEHKKMILCLVMIICLELSLEDINSIFYLRLKLKNSKSGTI